MIKTFLLKRGSTNFLRLVLTIIGLVVLALCVFALPSMWHGASAEFPMASTSILLIIICLYLTAVPFFIALWHVFKLLNYLDKNEVFSDQSINALKNIKYCGIVISVLYVIIVPLLFPIADADDAPGLLPIGLGIACLPIAVTVFVSVLQKLLENAKAFKSENDLTV
jgi:hypothetical protein